MEDRKMTMQEQSRMPMVHEQDRPVLPEAASRAPAVITQVVMPDRIGDMVCSLDLSRPSEIVLASILTSPSDATIESLVGQTIRIRAAMLTYVQLASLRNPGEIEEKVMAVFVTTTGVVVSTTTQPVCRLMLLLMRTRPPGEWVPPIECAVRAHKPQEKGKHDYYSLRVFEQGTIQ